MVDADDLVGAAEIAARMGVKSGSLVQDWVARYPDFPEPAARLARGHVWLWSEVEAWGRRTRRLADTTPTT
jgi:hypothetical protein